MIRNTRKETVLNDVKRNIHTIWLHFTKEELSAYQEIEQITDQLSTFSKITFLRELCSSREACFISLQKLVNDQHSQHTIQPIISKIEQLPHHVKEIGRASCRER